METQHSGPGPYTIKFLGHALAAHAPAVLRGLPRLVAGFRGDGALRGETRIAVQLRLARLLGCPVCRALFPAIGRRAGLTEETIKAAMNGELSALAGEAAAAVAWVEEIVRSGGHPVLSATGLGNVQREHLLVLTRLDMIVHSVGLMFLPHQMIEHAHQR